MNFLEQIESRAKAYKKTIVLPEANDVRVLAAASMIAKKDLADIILIGNRKDIETLGKGLDLSSTKIIDHLNSKKINEYADVFFNMRKTKGIDCQEAVRIMADPLYFGAMMVKADEADGMVAGAVHSTSDTLRAALQVVGTVQGISRASGFFIMIVPECEYGQDGIFLYADSGLIENPTAEQLAEIAIASARSFKAFVKAEPKVAMLSYATHGSAKSEMTEKITKAVELAKQKAPQLILDGELQFDAAIVPAISKSKAPGSIVEGNANVLIFPDLNCGNIAYKITQRLAKAEAYGLITQGLAKPINDLSRGCSADDIVGVVAITAVQAQNIQNDKCG